MSFVPNPKELEMVERAEHEAWAALAEARDRHRASEGGAAHEDHELLHRLSEDWRKALNRLHHARGGGS